MRGRLSRLHVYPYLLAIWSVLQLYAVNQEMLAFSETIYTTIASVIITGALVFVIKRILGNSLKTNVLVSFIVLMFFMYGHVEHAFVFFKLGTGAQLILYPLWLAILALGCFSFVKVRTISQKLTAPLTLMSVVLVSFPVTGLALNFEQLINPIDESLRDHRTVVVSQLEMPDDPPDIYYIILDEYSRADELEKHYGYDNQPFLDALEERGFYVASDSHSNYALTFISLASSTNMIQVHDYVQNLHSHLGYYWLVENNEVALTLKEMGYTYTLFNSGWGPTNRPTRADIVYPYLGMSEFNFEGILFSKTILNPFFPAIMSRSHRQTLESHFDNLVVVAGMEEPTFTFAHFVTPHHPYVFRADGSPIPAAEVRRLLCCPGPEDDSPYIAQLQYTNTKVIEAVDAILAESETPPIIIIQGDHGITPRTDSTNLETFANERLSILNAYYLPGGGEQALYPNITPVNSFRVVFNAYFGAELELEEDISYLSWYGYPEDYIDVTELLD